MTEQAPPLSQMGAVAKVETSFEYRASSELPFLRSWQSLTSERTDIESVGSEVYNTAIFICWERRAFRASFLHYEGLRIEAFPLVNNCFV